MQLSKLQPKYKSCLGPSSISVAIAENTCERSLWLQNRFKAQNNDTIFLERYKLKHQAALSNLVKHLSINFPKAIIDSEQQLPLVNFQGINFFAIPDLVIRHPEDNSLSVFDVKTGARKTSHFYQIAIYFLMIKAIAKKKGVPEPKLNSLAIVYDNGETEYDQNLYEKKILEIKGPSAIDQIFLEGTKERLREVLNIASQSELPEAKASSSNCRYCKFNDLCPEASKDEALIITNDLF